MEHEPSPDTTSLKTLRTARSLSQNEVAEAIGTNSNTVSRWERGIANPSPYYRRKLAELFEVDLQTLFSDLNGKTDKTTAELPPDPETTGGLPNQTEGTSQKDQATAGLSPESETIGGLLTQTEDASQENRQAPLARRQNPSRSPKILPRLYIPVAIIILFMLILGGFLFFLHRTPPDLFPALCSGNFQLASTPANISIVPTPATSTSPDGEPIGLSEGATIFDLNRPKQQEVQYKLQAAQDWVNNPQDVISSLQNAISIDPTDAEAQIYLENWRVLGSNHPHITFIVGVSFSPTSDEKSLADYNGTSHDALQGAFTAQKECNDQHTQDNSQTQVVLMLANISANIYGHNGDDNETFVARQIAYQQATDPTIVGIMGWLFSAHSFNMNHLLKANGNLLPMVSPASATDDLKDMFRFFRICNTNSDLAQIAANFTLNFKHKKRISIIYADDNTYADTLKKDFQDDIKNNSAGPAVSFTGGNPDTLQSALQTVLAQNPDAIFLAGYHSDLFQLLRDLGDLTRKLSIIASPALDATSDYPNSFPNMGNVYFPSTGDPGQWGNVTPQPLFFQEYKDNFGTLTARNGLPSIDADDMSSYDALLTLLYASQQALSKHNNTITPSSLENELQQITVAHPIQGITGRIAFDSNGNQVPDKMTFIKHIDGNKVVIDKHQGCLRVTDNCGS